MAMFSVIQEYIAIAEDIHKVRVILWLFKKYSFQFIFTSVKSATLINQMRVTMYKEAVKHLQFCKT